MKCINQLMQNNEDCFFRVDEQSTYLPPFQKRGKYVVRSDNFFNACRDTPAPPTPFPRQATTHGLCMTLIITPPRQPFEVSARYKKKRYANQKRGQREKERRWGIVSTKMDKAASTTTTTESCRELCGSLLCSIFIITLCPLFVCLQ